MEKKQVNSIFASLRQKHYKRDNEETHYNSIDVLSEDPEMKMLIQKINKKSQKTTTTRKKALEEMLESLKKKDSIYFKKFVKMFLLILEKLIQAENSREILVLLNKLVAIFIEKNSNVIKKNFDQFFPILFFLCFNDLDDVQLGAKENLNKLLKNKEKKSKAFKMFYKNFVEFVTPYLKDDESHFQNISIYQNKETDSIIFQRNKAMSYNALAESLNYSEFWKDEKQQILEELISLVFKGNTSKKSKPKILKLYEECKFDYIMKTSIANFISSIFANDLDQYIQNDVKKIIEFFLFQHLDDNLQTVQKIYWDEDFIFNLVKKSKELKYDVNNAEQGLLKLIEFYGYGAGKNFYKKLPDFLVLIYENRNWKTVKGKLGKIIDLHFKALNEGKQAIDVYLHINAGFDILNKFLEAKKEQQDEYEELKQQLIPQYLLQIIDIYIQINLPQQRNLFVLGVNNVKHIPPQICQYLNKLSTSEYESICQNFLNEFKNFFDKNVQTFTQSHIQNISIFCFYVIKLLGENQFFDDLLELIFNKFQELFFELCQGIDENNFKQQYQCIYNLEFFFSEICQTKLKNQIKKSEIMMKAIQNFDQQLQNYFINNILKGEISNQLFQRKSMVDFTELICQLLRVFNEWINYQNILQVFQEQLDDNKTLKTDQLQDNLVLFFYENQVGKKIVLCDKQNLETHIEDLITNRQHKLPFFAPIISQENFEKIIFKMQSEVLVKGINQYRPILNQYIQHVPNLQKLIQEWIDIDSNQQINYNKQFDLNMIYFLQMFQNSDDTDSNQQLIVDTIINLACSNQNIDSCITKFEILDKKKQLKLFEIFFLSLFKNEKFSDNKKYFLKVYMKNFLNKNYDKQFQIDYYDKYFQMIIQNQQKYNRPQLFRVLVRHFQTISNVQQILTLSFNSINFHQFYQQQFLNKNLLSHKQQQFWDNFNSKLIEVLMDLEEDDQQIFENEFKKILEQSFNEIYSFSFLIRFLSKYYGSSEKDEDQKNDKAKKTFENFLNFQQKKNSFQNILYFEQLIQIVPKFMKSTIFKYLDESNQIKKDFLLNLILFIERNQDVKNVFSTMELEQQNKSIEEFSQQNIKLIQEIDTREELSYYEKSYLVLKIIQLCMMNDIETILAENIEKVEDIFLQTLSSSVNYFQEPYSQNCYFQMLKLLRKIITVLEMFSEETQKNLLQQILTTSFNIVTHIKKLGEIQTLILSQFLEEIAETISRFGLNDTQSFKINDILKLYEIEVNSIKKSAFYLLLNLDYKLEVNEEELAVLEDDKFNYDLLINLPQKFQQILMNPEKISFSSFLLYWHILIYYCDGLSQVKKKNQLILSQLFTQENSFFMKMLNRIFKHLVNQQMTDRQLKDTLEQCKLLNPQEDWNTYLTDDVLEQFAFHIVLKISSMFPLSMRKWLDTADKKLANFGYLVMKTRINKVIFEQEIENIELNQKDWKDETFNIFLKKRTKEIHLVYTQDDTNIELTLKIPDNYPIQGLDIKMHECKSIQPSLLLKFKIMIVKLLNKENLNLVNAIIKWKENIDKDFMGYEPCPICYYVIDSRTSQLPKKKCKTCEKKFHAACIFKWFKTSGHSDCPMCKTNFL